MRGNRLTPAQRDELLAVYLDNPQRAKKLAKQLGVSRSYAAQLAGRRGTPRIDPRWEWAKQRGAVIT